MPVRTTFEWPDPDDDEPDRTESYSESPIADFSDAPLGDTVGTESLNSLLVEFTDSDIEFRNFDRDEPI